MPVVIEQVSKWSQDSKLDSLAPVLTRLSSQTPTTGKASNQLRVIWVFRDPYFSHCRLLMQTNQFLGCTTKNQ